MSCKQKDLCFTVSNTEIRKTIYYNDIYMRLKALSINRVKWEGFPDTVSERFLELTLFDRGYALFFQDTLNLAYYALPCMINGRFNIYNIPIDRVAYAVNGYRANRNESNSVLVMENYQMRPTAVTIDIFALRLTRILMTIDVNLNAINQPVIVKGDKTQIQSLKRAYQEFTGLSPVMFVDKMLDAGAFQVINTGAQYYIDKLRMEFFNVWCEAMTFLGIDNSNTMKKERLITDEVESNNSLIGGARAIAINARQQACDEINKMFGLSVSVDFNENVGIYAEEGVSDNVEMDTESD